MDFGKKDSRTVIDVAVAADDGYAMPLAISIRSLLERLSEKYRAKISVLDGGISELNKGRCERSWDLNCIGVDWIKPRESRLNRLRSGDHFTIATFYRVLIAECLPSSINRIVYTDPDVLFLQDISPIYDIALAGNLLAASQDNYCPYVDNRLALPNFDLAREYICNVPSIPETVDHSPNPYQRYFNAGFFIADLDRFRELRVGPQILDYCLTNNDRLIWADQCGMNACLGDKWLQLDPSWNVIPHLYKIPDYRACWFDEITFSRIRNSPSMVHFAGPEKPWHLGNDHPFRRQFYEVLDRTDWSGWRPPQQVPGPTKERRKTLMDRVNVWLRPNKSRKAA